MIEVSLASLFLSCVSLFSYWVLQTGIWKHSTFLTVKIVFFTWKNFYFFSKNVYQNCSEYNLYWFISNAGLPANISSLCSKNSTDPDCEIYNSEVVPNLATMNICGSVISLVVLRLFVLYLNLFNSYAVGNYSWILFNFSF